MTDKPHNAGNAESVAEQKRKAKLATDQQEADLRTLLKMPEFRRYVWRHMGSTCGLMETCASPNGSVQSMNIGKRDVAISLWAELERIDPLVIPLMMQETFQAKQGQK